MIIKILDYHQTKNDVLSETLLNLIYKARQMIHAKHVNWTRKGSKNRFTISGMVVEIALFAPWVRAVRVRIKTISTNSIPEIRKRLF